MSYTTMPYKTVIRLLVVARNPTNGFPARLLARRIGLAPEIGLSPRGRGWTGMDSDAAPTCRPPPNATWTGWGWASRTCSTTRWPCCTIRTTGRPTPGLCGWSGRASRCPAGPLAPLLTPRRNWWLRPRGAGSHHRRAPPRTGGHSHPGHHWRWKHG